MPLQNSETGLRAPARRGFTEEMALDPGRRGFTKEMALDPGLKDQEEFVVPIG